MIKDFAASIRSPQLFLPLLLFVIGGLGLSMAWNLYAEQANREVPDTSVQPKKNGVPPVQEVRSMLAGTPDEEGEDLEVIAEKNLFTRDRKKWMSPEEKRRLAEGKNDPAKNEEQQEEEARQQAAAERVRRIPRSSIRLYGTTHAETKKVALMYMEPFEAKRKYYTVQEGEILRDSGERGEWLYFKVSAIDENSVTLEDPGGESFQVGLFDHQRQEGKTSSRDTTGIQISVGGEEVKMQPVEDQDQKAETKKARPEDQKDGSQASTGQDQEGSGNATTENANAPDTGEGSEGDDDGQGQQNGSRSLIDALKKLGNRGSSNNQDSTPQQESNQGSDGKENMRKIETPFGTIYRPAN
jgi:hypothetical protein